MTKTIKLITVLTISYSLLSILPAIRPVYAAILFEDNFNKSTIDEVLDRWEIPRNNCSTNWVLKNGTIGININKTGGCETEFAPKDSVWGNWANYIYEVDATFVSGVDKNFAFRYNTTPEFKFYDFHFQVGGTQSTIYLERIKKPPEYPNKTTYPATNGNTYHIKIVANDNHITLLIDGNMVLDYPDSGGLLTTGKIALRAGVGGVNYTEVYFDNVVVSSIDPTPTPTPPAGGPIVILPGLTGSWCKTALITGGDCSGSWTALPEPLDPYDSLITSISTAADINSGGVYAWYYDWRKNISDLSGLLSNYIDNTVLSGQPAGTKVNLVGHSYGGLISAKYSEDHSDKVEKIISVGSPHQGSVNAYPAWEGGELYNYPLWQKALIRILFTAQGNLFKTNKDIIQSQIPSIKSILPTFDYLTDTSDQTISESSLKQRNPELPANFTSLDQIKHFLTTISGQNQDTLGSIKINPPNWVEKSLELWEDGKPNQYINIIEGDSTVLKSSAKYVNASSAPEITTTHLGLITETDGINSILNSLGSLAPAQIVDHLPDENSGNVIFLLRSPATMTVQFNGQNYSDTDGFIMIENIDSGIADVVLTGTGSGIYHLDIIELHSNGDNTHTYSGEISTGQQISYQLNLNPSAPPDMQLIDTTGEIHLNLAGGNLSEVKTILDNSSGRTRSLQILISSVNQAQTMINAAISQIDQPVKSLSSAQSSLLSVHNFRQTLNTYEMSGQIPESDAVKIRQLTQSTVNNLQSAFIVLSVRADRTFTDTQIHDLDNLINNIRVQVDQKGNNASWGLIPAAVAYQNAAANQQKSHYVHKYSARLYLEEANNILR